MTGTSFGEVARKMASTLRELLLTMNMVGLESALCMENILMIANIQTLGVPVQYSSLPGTVAAAVGIVLIPCLGVLVDKWATSKKAKAKILVMVNCVEVAGIALVFAGNFIKLFIYDQIGLDPEFNATTYFPGSARNVVESTTTLDFNSTTELADSSFSALVTASPEVESAGIKYYAILVMIGFALTDFGYDSSNCILKTFSLACTPPEKHESNILKSIFVSSLGGCLMSILGSVGPGELLTAGTHHDSNAAQCAFLSALSFVLVLITMSCTILSGFCCPPMLEEPTYKRVDDDNVDETSHLVPTSAQQERSNFSTSQRTWFLSYSGSLRVDDFQPTVPASDSLAAAPETIHIADSSTLPSHDGNKVLQFLKNKKKYIILNIATYFYFGGLYAFGIFSANFVGINVFKGDPAAKLDTEEYTRYLEGLKVGSQGTLTFYVTFTVFSPLLQPIMDRVGKKLLFILISGVFVATAAICATMAMLPIYYITAALSGVLRCLIFSVPFIVANEFSKEDSIRNNTPYNSGVAIATVAAMLPCGFTVCSAIMGPLISATGTAAAPMYYAAVNVFLGSVTLFFLKMPTE